MPEIIYKKSRSNVPATDKQIHEIERLNAEEKLIDSEIGKRIGLSGETVRRYRVEMGLPSNRRKRRVDAPENHTEVDALTDKAVFKTEADWKTQCRETLRDRVRFDIRPGYHTLDGKPAMTQQIIDTHNRIAPMLSKPHIGKKPNEIYKPRLVQDYGAANV